MSRLINADALIKLWTEGLTEEEIYKYHIPLSVAIENIKDMPTVDVVRCRYPVFIKEDKTAGKDQPSWNVFVPDFDMYTEGYGFEDAKRMAIDLIENASDWHDDLPDASSKEEAIRKAKESANEIFDFSDGELLYL